MGVFDTVTVPCPCGGIVKFQSKGADYPGMDEYEGHRMVPLDVAADCSWGSCSECRKSFDADVYPKFATVTLKPHHECD